MNTPFNAACVSLHEGHWSDNVKLFMTSFANYKNPAADTCQYLTPAQYLKSQLNAFAFHTGKLHNMS